jgi:hypothetical protein
MLALKGMYDGNTVTLERNLPITHECEVIVTFLENRPPQTADDGSLAWLFRDYSDDGIREPIADFGEAVGNEQW